MRTHTTLGKSMLRAGTSAYIQMGALIAQTITMSAGMAAAIRPD